MSLVSHWTGPEFKLQTSIYRYPTTGTHSNSSVLAFVYEHAGSILEMEGAQLTLQGLNSSQPADRTDPRRATDRHSLGYQWGVTVRMSGFFSNPRPRN